MQSTLTRRAGLRLLGAAGALLPLRMVFAAPASTHEDAGPRLVVVMLRGALDGLAAVPAQGDPAWAALLAWGWVWHWPCRSGPWWWLMVTRVCCLSSAGWSRLPRRDQIIFYMS